MNPVVRPFLTLPLLLLPFMGTLPLPIELHERVDWQAVRVAVGVAAAFTPLLPRVVQRLLFTRASRVWRLRLPEVARDLLPVMALHHA